MHKQNPLRITKGITLTELALSPYFSIINVYLEDINVFARFDEIPSLPVENIKENFNVWKLESKKNEIKGQISSSRLIHDTSAHCPCVPSFNLLGLTVSEWLNHRVTEGQGKSSIAPTFSKQGYKNIIINQRPLNKEHFKTNMTKLVLVLAQNWSDVSTASDN